MTILKMKIRLRKSAIKDLKKITHKEKETIHKHIVELQNFPHISNIKKLTKFEPAYRLRVGNYRILFDIEDDIVIIGRILHRRESYR